MSRSGGEIGGTARPCGGPTDGMLITPERKTAWLHGAACSRKRGLSALIAWLDRASGRATPVERRRTRLHRLPGVCSPRDLRVRIGGLCLRGEPLWRLLHPVSRDGPKKRRMGAAISASGFIPGFASAIAKSEINGEDIVYQVKAFTRTSKDSKRAATAGEALRLFREMQAGSGVTSCASSRRVCWSASPNSSGRRTVSRTCAPDVSSCYGLAMHKTHNRLR